MIIKDRLKELESCYALFITVTSVLVGVRFRTNDRRGRPSGLEASAQSQCGMPMNADTLVRLAATEGNHDKMRQHLADSLGLLFVARGLDGVYIPTGDV